MNTSTTARRAGRLLAAFTLVLSAACNDSDAQPRSLPSPTPSLPVAVTPRPPGPPLYYPLPHFKGPNPVDVKFALTLTPYHGLTYGSRFTVVLSYTSKESKPVAINPYIGFGDQTVVRVVDSGGGKVQQMDNHDTSTRDKYPFFVTSVEFSNYRLKPGVTKIRVVAEVMDVKCPGGGDFITEVAGSVGRVVKRGSGGGRHLMWVENDAQDYAKKRVAEGARNTAPPHSVCRPQSVE